MEQKSVKNTILIAMAAIILMMMAATVVEKLTDTDFAIKYFYHNPCFIALWALVAILSLIYISKRHLKAPALMLHLSFILILVGAFVTWTSSEEGQIHLYLDEPNATILHKDGNTAALPFTVCLKDFTVSHYEGSMAPSDYQSTVVIEDGCILEISMNKVGKYRSYRFYQTSYDQNLRGSILTVTHDPFGIGITYTAYLLLLISMISFFFQKESIFRSTLRRLSASLPLLLLLLLPTNKAQAEDTLPCIRNGELSVIPESVAAKFGDLYVYYNDRVAPFSTMARDYCLKAYGKSSYNGYSAEQVVVSWLFYYDSWRAVPFKLKAKDVGGAVEAEKEDMLMRVASGRAFTIFPINSTDAEMPEIIWCSCDSRLPSDIDQGLWIFIRRSLDLIHEQVRQENWDEVINTISAIEKYQLKTAGEYLPSERKLKAELLYNRISRPMVPFMICITLGLLLFILFGFRLASARKFSKIQFIEGAAADLTNLHIFFYLSLVLALRWYVSGHAPLAGSYSVMMLMAWLCSIFTMALRRKFPLIRPLGLLLEGFTMLVASLASANPQITHLMPVLQSPLLSIHVLSMMISYCLLGIVALNGFMSLCVSASDTASDYLMDVSRVILYPAVFLLCFGTFLGAVWANQSWGRYWAWDPKETWALITMLIYSVLLHPVSIKFIQKPKVFHLYSLLAFLSVLITYFGVNLILGGLHAYA